MKNQEKVIFALSLAILVFCIKTITQDQELDTAQTAIKRAAKKSAVMLNKMSEKYSELYNNVKGKLENSVINSEKFTSAIEQAATQQYETITQSGTFTPSEQWPPLSDFIKDASPYMAFLYKMLASKAYYELLLNKIGTGQTSSSSESSASESSSEESYSSSYSAE